MAEGIPRSIIYGILQLFHDKLPASRKSGSGRPPFKLPPRKIGHTSALLGPRTGSRNDKRKATKTELWSYDSQWRVKEAEYKSSKEKRHSTTYSEANCRWQKIVRPTLLEIFEAMLDHWRRVVFHFIPLDHQWETPSTPRTSPIHKRLSNFQ